MMLPALHPSGEVLPHGVLVGVGGMEFGADGSSLLFTAPDPLGRPHQVSPLSVRCTGKGVLVVHTTRGAVAMVPGSCSEIAGSRADIWSLTQVGTCVHSQQGNMCTTECDAVRSCVSWADSPFLVCDHTLTHGHGLCVEHF